MEVTPADAQQMPPPEATSVILAVGCASVIFGEIRSHSGVNSRPRAAVIHS